MATDIKAISANDSITRGNLGQRYLRASLDSVLRGGASLVIGGFVPMVLARFLGPHDFGIYSILTALTALIAGLFHMGQNSALHKLLPEYYVSDRERGGAILANVVTFTVALIIVLGMLAGCEIGASAPVIDAFSTLPGAVVRASFDVRSPEEIKRSDQLENQLVKVLCTTGQLGLRPLLFTRWGHTALAFAPTLPAEAEPLLQKYTDLRQPAAVVELPVGVNGYDVAAQMPAGCL